MNYLVYFLRQFDGSDRNKYYDIVMEIENILEELEPSHLSKMFTGQFMCESTFLYRNTSNPIKLFKVNSLNISDFPPVTDDHKPFWELGVDQILHIIPTPFPNVWHTMEDNASALDYEYIDRINQILQLFVAQMIQQ